MAVVFFVFFCRGSGLGGLQVLGGSEGFVKVLAFGALACCVVGFFRAFGMSWHAGEDGENPKSCFSNAGKVKLFSVISVNNPIADWCGGAHFGLRPGLGFALTEALGWDLGSTLYLLGRALA